MYDECCQGCRVFSDDCSIHGTQAVAEATAKEYTEHIERVKFLRQALDAIDQAGVPLDVQSKVQALLRGWDESALDVAWMALQAEIEEQVNGDFSAAEHAFSVARDSLTNSGE